MGQRHSTSKLPMPSLSRIFCDTSQIVSLHVDSIGGVHAKSWSTNHRSRRHRRRCPSASARAAPYPGPWSCYRRRVRAEDGGRSQAVPTGCWAYRRRDRRSANVGRAPERRPYAGCRRGRLETSYATCSRSSPTVLPASGTRHRAGLTGSSARTLPLQSGHSRPGAVSLRTVS